MGPGARLRLLLLLGALWGTGATETLLGTLGEATLLRVPPHFQNLTREFGEASWKRFTEGSQTKEFLLKVSRGNPTEFEPGRMRFHERDFSLEILNTSRDDGRLYEYSVSTAREEELWQIQLQVLEPVAHPRIRILGRDLSGGRCRLALRCSAERGDAVSYAWDSGDSGDSGDSWDSGSRGLCSGHGPVLNVSFPLGSAAAACACTARNAVSSRRAAFDAAQCGFQRQGVPGVRTELLVPLVSLGVIVIVIAVIVTLRATRAAKCDREPSQATADSAGATIYAQVQKPRVTVPKATPVSCTTIYATATGPPPAPEGAPAPLCQEPTTVYASVTLPVA